MSITHSHANQSRTLSRHESSPDPTDLQEEQTHQKLQMPIIVGNLLRKHNPLQPPRPPTISHLKLSTQLRSIRGMFQGDIPRRPGEVGAAPDEPS